MSFEIEFCVHETTGVFADRSLSVMCKSLIYVFTNLVFLKAIHSREYWLEQLRRSKSEVEVVLGVDVELHSLIGGLEPRPVDFVVNWSVVWLLDDVQLDTECFRHCSEWPRYLSSDFSVNDGRRNHLRWRKQERAVCRCRWLYCNLLNSVP